MLQVKTTKETNRFSDARALLGFGGAFLFISHVIFSLNFRTYRTLLLTWSRFLGLFLSRSCFSISPLCFSFLRSFLFPEFGPGCSSPRPGLLNRKWNRAFAFPLQTNKNKQAIVNKELVTQHLTTFKKRKKHCATTMEVDVEHTMPMSSLYIIRTTVMIPPPPPPPPPRKKVDARTV